MPVPSECPDCKQLTISVTSVPPDDHDFAGWVTKIECGACGFEAYTPELEQ